MLLEGNVQKLRPYDGRNRLLTDLLFFSLRQTVDLMHEQNLQADFSGTTLVCSCIFRGIVVTMNVGDSGAALFDARQPDVIQLNTMHEPSLPTERARIERSGGRVEPSDSNQEVLRVWLPD